MVKYDDAVRIKYCVYSVSDGDDCSVLEHGTSQSGLQQRIGLNIYCGL